MRIIKLTLYRGRTLLFNEDGKVQNENQSIKIADGLEWLNYIKLIQSQGFCKVILESVSDVDSKSVKPVDKDYYEMIKKQLVDAVFDMVTDKPAFKLDFAKAGTTKVGNIELNTDELTAGSGQGNGAGAPKTAKQLKEEKKAVRDALKERAAKGNLEFRPSMSTPDLEKLLIENNL